MATKYIYIARILLEAETILSIGSDSLHYDQDQPVDKDWNNLPYIPATTITGFLRKCIPNESLFGDEKNNNNNVQTNGSNFICSDALLHNGSGVLEELVPKLELEEKEVVENDKFYYRYLNLPLRQHTAINHLGSADDGSKFDNEFVYKGSRFLLEISLEVDKKCEDEWKEILNSFYRNDFYLGAGETNNYGLLSVVEINHNCFDLTTQKGKNNYLNFDVSLNNKEGLEKYELEDDIEKEYNEEEITFSGKNSFFHFGAGIGDGDVDDANYTEIVVVWENNKPNFVTNYVIPGTSIKGALAHRVAFHYNNEKEISVESILEKALASFELEPLPNTIEELELQKQELEKQLAQLKEIDAKKLFQPYVGSNNNGVKTIFGSAKNTTTEEGQMGSIIVEDTYLNKEDYNEIVFNHNKIDRFTGGTINSALFNEKVLEIPEVTFKFKYKNNVWEIDALKNAITDLENGLLPIGGKVNKGHGILIKK